jgi:hypothetical protein
MPKEDSTMVDRADDPSKDAVEVLRAVWAVDGQDADDLEDLCGPQKSCKNMVGVSFDGLAGPGADLKSAWRDKLAREGKLSTTGNSIRDLVLGSSNSH